MDMKLREQVYIPAIKAGIDPLVWGKFVNQLETLDEETANHSLRVGLLCHGLAREEKLDRKYALFAGCGHDIGKAHCEIQEVLYKPDFDECDYEIVKKHSWEGFKTLRDVFPMTALVAGLHHPGYAIDLDAHAPAWMDYQLKKTVLDMTKLVMICDFYDALTTRNNDKGYLVNRSVGEVMTEHFPHEPTRVDWLMTNGQVL